MFLNALEHGVLNLSSELKDNDFEGFYLLKEDRLKNKDFLQNKFIKINFSKIKKGNNYFFNIKVEDSGPGFNFMSFLDKKVSYHMDEHDAIDAFHGRGLKIILNFASSVIFTNNGNTINVEIPLSIT